MLKMIRRIGEKMLAIPSARHNTIHSTPVLQVLLALYWTAQTAVEPGLGLRLSARISSDHHCDSSQPSRSLKELAGEVLPVFPVSMWMKGVQLTIDRRYLETKTVSSTTPAKPVS